MSLEAVPLTLRQANAMVDDLHRHHKPVRGHRFSIGARRDGVLVGVVIVGRPVARNTSQYDVAEVTRLVTDGTSNACSFLYARAAQAARAMGYRKIQTFILESEPGTSLRATGWAMESVTREGDHWMNRSGRRDDQPTESKTRWAKVLT